jgi:hypothetical protein
MIFRENYRCAFGATISSWFLKYRADSAIHELTLTNAHLSHVHAIEQVLTGIGAMKNTTLSLFNPEQLNFFIAKVAQSFSLLMQFNAFMLIIVLFMCFRVFYRKKHED